MEFNFYSKKAIKYFLKEDKLFINKKYGQNFLINAGVVDTIINKAQITKKDIVFEIGCGLGGLTNKLLNTGAQIVGFEIDKAYSTHLLNIFAKNNNFNLYTGDFLKIADKVISKYNLQDFKQIIFVGNLPYYITTPILEKIFTMPYNFNSAYFMMQKEVAQRIMAKSGTKKYGSISIFCNYHSNIKTICDISSKSFFPQPNVDSIVMEFTNKKNFNVDNEKLFFKISRSLFINRRKQLKNNLLLSPFLTNVEKELTIDSLTHLNISTSIRGEMLSIPDIVKIANEVNKNLKHI